MKATIASLIFLLLSLAVSSQTYKYIGNPLAELI